MASYCRPNPRSSYYSIIGRVVVMEAPGDDQARHDSAATLMLAATDTPYREQSLHGMSKLQASATWAHRRGGGVLGYSRAKLARRSPLQLIGTPYSTSPYSGEKAPTSACSDKWHDARDHALSADLDCMIFLHDFLSYRERATLLHVNCGHLWELPGSGRRYLAATAISASHNVA